MTNFDIQVYNALRELYMPAHIRGYEFLKTAMKIIHKDPQIIHSMMQLYIDVAKEHNTTSTKVERGIRYAITQIRVDDAGMYKILGRVGHMCNSEFLMTLNESIKIKMAVEDERFKGTEHYREFHESRDELQELPNKF